MDKPIFLMDANREWMKKAESEIAYPIGQLITPLSRFNNHGYPWFGIDSGAYTRFNAKGYRTRLAKELPNIDRCLFVAVPDVVGNARRTLECWHVWYQELKKWPVALVMQDGIENLDIPWEQLSAVFIGGTDAFKKSQEAIQFVKAAKILGKWALVGRVNTWERLDRFAEVGMDSFDGTGLSLNGGRRRQISLPRFDYENSNGISDGEIRGGTSVA